MRRDKRYYQVRVCVASEGYKSQFHEGIVLAGNVKSAKDAAILFVRAVTFKTMPPDFKPTFEAVKCQTSKILFAINDVAKMAEMAEETIKRCAPKGGN